MTIVREPHLDLRQQQAYLGIRVQVAMKGMSKVVGKLMGQSQQHRLGQVG